MRAVLMWAFILLAVGGVALAWLVELLVGPGVLLGYVGIAATCVFVMLAVAAYTPASAREMRARRILLGFLPVVLFLMWLGFLTFILTLMSPPLGAAVAAGGLLLVGTYGAALYTVWRRARGRTA